MGIVVPLFASQSALDRAWAAYDEAQLEAVRLYRDPQSTAPQRRMAVLRALDLQKAFADLAVAQVRA
jgi:hypothetical protein